MRDLFRRAGCFRPCVRGPPVRRYRRVTPAPTSLLQLLSPCAFAPFSWLQKWFARYSGGVAPRPTHGRSVCATSRWHFPMTTLHADSGGTKPNELDTRGMNTITYNTIDKNGTRDTTTCIYDTPQYKLTRHDTTPHHTRPQHTIMHTT